MLSTPRLQLKLLGPSHAAEATRYLAKNREHFGTAGPLVEDEYFTEEYQRRRLTRELEMIDEGSLFRLWLYRHADPADSDPIGDISLSHNVRGIMQSCYVGYKLDRDHVGHGYMTEALGAVVGFAFDRLKLHRVEANIMPRNVASMRVVEKLGFTNEGYSRAYLMINGRWEDHHRYAKINDAWNEAAAVIAPHAMRGRVHE
jgi:ribosomal-protein-alanine N-acetyltransferase